MDERINIKYARANFSKTLSTKKQPLEIDTAKHADLWRISRDDYFDKTLGVLNTYLQSTQLLETVD